MPSAAAIARSSGVVMNPRTRSALAPTYTVVTGTAALSLRGYCRTTRVRIAWTPAIKITRFTTRASTGRRMNRSVNFMEAARGSTIGRVRRQVVLRRQVVVLDYRHAVAQFEDAGTDNALAGLEARFDAHKISPRGPGADELLPHGQTRLSLVLTRLRFDHIHRVAVGRAQDRGGRDLQHRLLFRQEHFDAGKHARAQQLLRILERSLQAHAARLRIQIRIDGGELALEGPARIRVGRDMHPHARLQPRQLLLRQ